MGSASFVRPDHADLRLLAALTEHARIEVADLSRRVGLPARYVRDRLRRLERAGMIRGYHAAVSTDLPAPFTGEHTLIMLRFPAGARPTTDALCRLPGVSSVHALCSSWDYMVELDGSADQLLGAYSGRRGVAELLGAQADFEVLPVLRRHRSPAQSEPDQISALPPA